MPIPLLFIGIAAATGALGIGKSVKAGVDTHKAKKVNESANDIINSAAAELKKAKRKSGKSLQKLGKAKATILSTSVTDFVNAFEKFKNIEFTSSIGLDELSKFRIDKQSLSQLKDMGGYATSIMSGVATGAMGGALTAFGAYSAAGMLATASTGTAIATLSGAAATNATLAFFGGGSLAAGGLGIAGGTAVLGGLVAGPALAIMGFIVGAKASKSKNEALSNLAIARKNSQEMNLAATLCYGIAARSDMFVKLLSDLRKRLDPLITRMVEIEAEYGRDYRKLPQKSKETLAAACSLAGCIKAVIDTPILTKEGNLTNESADILKELNNKGEVSLTKGKSNKKRDIDHLVQSVSSNIRDEKHEDSKSIYEGNINWDKLRVDINKTYGTTITSTEMRASIDNYGSSEIQNLEEVTFDCVELICLYQVGHIVQSCSQKDILNSFSIPISAIDWKKLNTKLLTLYGTKINASQLNFQKDKDGNVNVNIILSAIIDKFNDKSPDKKCKLLYADEYATSLA